MKTCSKDSFKTRAHVELGFYPRILPGILCNNLNFAFCDVGYICDCCSTFAPLLLLLLQFGDNCLFSEGQLASGSRRVRLRKTLRDLDIELLL